MRNILILMGLVDPLCYLSIVDPHGGFGFDVQTLETATVADLKKLWSMPLSKGSRRRNVF
ncbi:hypothetical protein Scep_029465 [Stephania cephalantha]|uniref:Uncharacterized protein n=1 Tax=Stephania cephalantha TaxID=152367 RepID=A0AAP0HDJ7_9MAGN